MVLTEYDEKKHISNEKQISWEEGCELKAINVATKMLKEKFPLDTIINISELPKEKIISIAESLGVSVT